MELISKRLNLKSIKLALDLGCEAGHWVRLISKVMSDEIFPGYLSDLGFNNIQVCTQEEFEKFCNKSKNQAQRMIEAVNAGTYFTSGGQVLYLIAAYK